MKTALVLFFTVLFFSALAQHNPQQGNVNIISDPRISQLAEEYQDIASQIHGIEGYRVQIFFDSGNLSKRNATRARQDFIKRFPDVEAYIAFREPYYRVRVGDFRTKLEADGFRKRISKLYPHGFTVNEQINPPPIN